MLSEQEFKEKVRLAPLVSIDFIVKDPAGNVLLGMRNNRPAQGYLFVPGGSVRKGEDFYGGALPRIAWKEFGMRLRREDVHPIGLFRHSYADNFSGTEFGTDYFACGFRVIPFVERGCVEQREERPQHREWVWMGEAQLLQDPRVHPNTKAYFQKNPPNKLF